MINFECSEHFDFPPPEVYAAGIRRETWPQVDNIVLQPTEEELTIGGLVRVGLSLPKSPDLYIDGEVTELIENKRVAIEGESRAGYASLAFDLSPNKTGRKTDVDYSLGIGLKGLGRLAEPVVSAYLGRAVPEFAQLYRQNIIDLVTQERSLLKKVA